MKKYKILCLTALILAGILCGCGKSGKESGSMKEAAFTVVAPDAVPAELQKIIGENKKEEIRMTYEDGNDLYLIRGYGQQKTGGYSISVVSCEEDEKTVRFDTRLIGPPAPEGISKEPSYPCLVIKMEARDKEIMIE